MIEKRCYRCGEFWPVDDEFYNRLSDGRLHSYCRACCTERKRELRAGAPRKIKTYTRGSHATPAIRRRDTSAACPAV